MALLVIVIALYVYIYIYNTCAHEYLCMYMCVHVCAYVYIYMYEITCTVQIRRGIDILIGICVRIGMRHYRYYVLSIRHYRWQVVSIGQ